MKSRMLFVSILALVLLAPHLVRAQVPTSRQIPFNNVATTIAPGTPAQPLTIQLWDAAATPPGNLRFSEAQTLDVDATGAISFVFGSQTVNGLDPANFPSGASRFLDVVDSTGASVLNPPGRIPLNAVAFALSPGPAGPAGPQGLQGPAGPQGPPGVVQAVSPGDASIAIGGTAANPTVAVAANGITNANVANGALSAAKIAGTAATLGPNAFTGDQNVSGGVTAFNPTGFGVVGSSSGLSGTGVLGQVTATSGNTIGVRGVSFSPAGVGVSGETSNGIGVFARGSTAGLFQGNVQIGGNLSVNGANVAAATAVTVLAPAINSTAIQGTADINGTGVLGTSLKASVGVAGSSSGLCPFEVCFPVGVSGSATGGGTGVSGQADSVGVRGTATAAAGNGVSGTATAATGNTVGVLGSVNSPTGIGAEGVGPNTGVQGIATSTAFFAAAVFGHATAGSGVTRGVYGTSDSTTGIGVHGIAATGGQFETGSGNEIVGRGFGSTNFRVDATGRVFANGGFQASGADFAESVAVAGGRSFYQPGDLLAIDANSDRRLSLASRPYSSLVAGIYATKPGLLASSRHMDDPELAKEVPLAIVGIVPCKVTTENGPIERGDLLVSSSTPGYAMRGTDRSRMLGAVVGKALEPLASGKGVIEVLVTLQ